jgi:hypothetical protein
VVVRGIQPTLSVLGAVVRRRIGEVTPTVYVDAPTAPVA